MTVLTLQLALQMVCLYYCVTAFDFLVELSYNVPVVPFVNFPQRFFSETGGGSNSGVTGQSRLPWKAEVMVWNFMMLMICYDAANLVTGMAN